MNQGFSRVKQIHKKVLLQEYGIENLQVVQEKFLIPKLNEGQFLAKVYAAPINPIDINKVLGRIRNAQLPFTPGSECSGIILEGPQDILGQQVSFVPSEGSFTNYAIGNINQAIFFPSNTKMDQSACGFINPLTCCGLHDIALSSDTNAVINTAANSQLGKMIYRFISPKLRVINLVRGQDNVNKLREELNSEYVLDITSNNFDQQIKDLSRSLNAKLVLDCYSGWMTSRILDAMPPKSESIIYGSLIQDNIEGLSSIKLRWENKRLSGFTLFSWIEQCEKNKLNNYKQEIIKNIDTVFRSEIRGKFDISNIQEAFQQYQKDMSAGKILITMF